jgi:hypothetical protein
MRRVHDDTTKTQEVDAFLDSIGEADGFRLQMPCDGTMVRFMALRPHALGDQHLNGQALNAPSQSEAIEIFVMLLASYAGLLVRAPLGGCAFYGERFDDLFLLRGTIVAVIHAGIESEWSALMAAQTLDRRLAQFYPVG